MSSSLMMGIYVKIKILFKLHFLWQLRVCVCACVRVRVRACVTYVCVCVSFRGFPLHIPFFRLHAFFSIPEHEPDFFRCSAFLFDSSSDFFAPLSFIQYHHGRYYYVLMIIRCSVFFPFCLTYFFRFFHSIDCYSLKYLPLPILFFITWGKKIFICLCLEFSS